MPRKIKIRKKTNVRTDNPPFTLATSLILAYYGKDTDVRPGGAQSYKAPHAYRGTPEKPRRPRQVWDKMRATYGPTFKLFKGHRP